MNQFWWGQWWCWSQWIWLRWNAFIFTNVIYHICWMNFVSCATFIEIYVIAVVINSSWADAIATILCKWFHFRYRWSLIHKWIIDVLRLYCVCYWLSWLLQFYAIQESEYRAKVDKKKKKDKKKTELDCCFFSKWKNYSKTLTSALPIISTLVFLTFFFYVIAVDCVIMSANAGGIERK